MGSSRTTNWLLLGIFLVLLVQCVTGTGIPSVLAETLRLDQCITGTPKEKPDSYVHVVTHNFAGD